MKGEVFLAFNQMVEDQLGIDCWEDLLVKVNPESQGIYTSLEAYKDEELFDLVTALSEFTAQPKEVLIEQFGEYLFKSLNIKYPIFTEQQPDFFSFIKSVDGVIHREVKKLYQTKNLPSLSCDQIDKTTLHVDYRSPRKLCVLAEGLIRGSAQHYNTPYVLKHVECMHKNSERCLFIITTE